LILNLDKKRHCKLDFGIIQLRKKGKEMDILLVVLGILTAICLLLALSNGLKPYFKHKALKMVYRNHKGFGMLATLFGLSHFLVAILNESLRLSGMLSLIALVLTGVFGMAFSKLKQKPLYIVHRGFAVITFVLIIVHIVVNTSF